jgi:hypothetical protein
MMHPLGSGGSVTELSVTGRYPGAVMGQHGTSALTPLVNFAHPRKVNNSYCAPIARLNVGERLSR